MDLPNETDGLDEGGDGHCRQEEEPRHQDGTDDGELGIVSHGDQVGDGLTDGDDDEVEDASQDDPSPPPSFPAGVAAADEGGGHEASCGVGENNPVPASSVHPVKHETAESEGHSEREADHAEQPRGDGPEEVAAGQRKDDHVGGELGREFEQGDAQTGDRAQGYGGEEDEEIVEDRHELLDEERGTVPVKQEFYCVPEEYSELKEAVVVLPRLNDWEISQFTEWSPSRSPSRSPSPSPAKWARGSGRSRGGRPRRSRRPFVYNSTGISRGTSTRPNAGKGLSDIYGVTRPRRRPRDPRGTRSRAARKRGGSRTPRTSTRGSSLRSSLEILQAPWEHHPPPSKRHKPAAPPAARFPSPPPFRRVAKAGSPSPLPFGMARVKAVAGGTIHDMASDPDLLRSFPDLQLGTSDGYRMQVNRAVLAASCPVLGRVLLEASKSDSEQPTLLLLDIRKSHLQAILDFAVTGVVPFGLKAGVKESFRSVGVDLDGKGMEFSLEGEAASGGFNFLADTADIEKPHFFLEQDAFYVNTQGDVDRGDDGLVPEANDEAGVDDFAEFPPLPPAADDDLLVDPETKPPKAEAKKQPAAKKRKAGRPPGLPPKPPPRLRPPSPVQIPDEPRKSSRQRQAVDRLFGEEDATEEVSEEEKAVQAEDSDSSEKDSDFDYDAEGMSEPDYLEEAESDKPVRRPPGRMKRKNHLVEWMRQRRREENGGVDPEPVKPKKPKRVRKRKPRPPKPRTLKPITFDYDGERDPRYKFQCEKCVYGAEKKQSLIKHMLRHAAVEAAPEGQEVATRYFCDVCHQGFEKTKELDEHHKQNHRNELTCQYCGKKYKGGWERMFREHVAFHEEQNRLGGCVQCGAVLDTKYKVKHHREKSGPYHDNRCAHAGCDVEFGTWQEHLDHLAVAHSGIRVHKCGDCGESFDLRSYMNKHRAEVHLTRAEKPLQVCPHCGNGFKSLEEHIERVHGTGTFTCDQCAQVCRSENALKVHVANSHQYCACETCGRTFSNPRKLEKHKLVQHVSEEERSRLLPHNCKYCGRGFAQLKSKLDHENVHTGAKPHVCSQCGHAFNNNSNLRHHVRAVHQGIKRAK